MLCGRQRGDFGHIGIRIVQTFLDESSFGANHHRFPGPGLFGEYPSEQLPLRFPVRLRQGLKSCPRSLPTAFFIGILYPRLLKRNENGRS